MDETVLGKIFNEMKITIAWDKNCGKLWNVERILALTMFYNLKQQLRKVFYSFRLFNRRLA